MSKLTPFGNQVVIRREEETPVAGNQEKPPNKRTDRPFRGEVLAVGRGRFLESGKLIEPEAKIGDCVVFSIFSGYELDVDGEPFWIIDEDELLATINK